MFRELRYDVPREILVHDEQSGAKIIKPRGAVCRARSRAHLAITRAHNIDMYVAELAHIFYIIYAMYIIQHKFEQSPGTKTLLVKENPYDVHEAHGKESHNWPQGVQHPGMLLKLGLPQQSIRRPCA